MTFHESLKPILDDDGRVLRSLRAVGVPLSDLFVRIRPDPEIKLKSEAGEYFLSIRTDNKYYYFRVTPSLEFADYLGRNTFTGVSGFEIIQQRSTRYGFLDSFLVCCNERQILGGLWFDYKTRVEVFAFFGIGVEGSK